MNAQVHHIEGQERGGKEDKQVKQHLYPNDSNYLNNFISDVRNLWNTLTIHSSNFQTNPLII